VHAAATATGTASHLTPELRHHLPASHSLGQGMSMTTVSAEDQIFWFQMSRYSDRYCFLSDVKMNEARKLSRHGIAPVLSTRTLAALAFRDKLAAPASHRESQPLFLACFFRPILPMHSLDRCSVATRRSLSQLN
jgi:hypothetical protein